MGFDRNSLIGRAALAREAQAKGWTVKEPLPTPKATQRPKKARKRPQKAVEPPARPLRMRMWIPGQPAGATHHAKFIGRRKSGTPCLLDSGALRAEKVRLRNLIPENPGEPWTGPIRVDLQFRWEEDQVVGTYPRWKVGKPDWDNSAKLVVDMLVRAGWMKNDSQVVIGTVEKVLAWPPAGIMVSMCQVQTPPVLRVIDGRPDVLGATVVIEPMDQAAEPSLMGRSHEAIISACYGACTCGGKEPGLGCPACELYHALYSPPESRTQKVRHAQLHT